MARAHLSIHSPHQAATNPFLGAQATSTAPVTMASRLDAVLEIEVKVAWGDCVIGVGNFAPSSTITLGEAMPDGRPCDFLIPSERLGFDCLPIVEFIHGSATVTIPRGADGWLVENCGTRVSLERLRMQTPQHPTIAGAHLYELCHLEGLILKIGIFTISIHATTPVARIRRKITDMFDASMATTVAATFCGAGAFIGALAYNVPSLGALDDEGIDEDQVRTIQQYMTAIAERNRELEAQPTVASPEESERGGHSGSRSPGEGGKMGSTVSKRAAGRYGIVGPADNPAPHLGRAELIEQARNFGMVELLGTLNTAQNNGLSSPWGHDVASGRDSVEAMGQLFGDTIGDSAGLGGLTLSGTGQGGGCVGGGCGKGIGLTGIGTIGGGMGNCDPSKGPCDGMGRGSGLGNGPGHRTKVPRVRPEGITSVSGRLPPEVIQRIVRQNYGRFRFCYEQGLTRNPNLEGRVVTRFVINRDGAVSNAQSGGSDLPDAQVNSCIVQSFYGLSFPPPEGGIVTVTYPISLQPG